ncbi:MAG: T9SS type A sorting domain-containing protein [Bacteroidota bacterium]|nr:T9SS type A sorting domain-containing protein [Bacteroidota bacterium]
MRFLFLLLIFSFSLFSAFSQEKLRVLQYNLLYYGTYPSWCPITENDPDYKDGYIKTIVDYVQPDVFCVNELGAGNTNATRILENALNTDSPGKFQRGISTNNGFSSIVNQLFYNSHKLALYSQEQVSQDINNNDLARVIDLYTLYFKASDLAQTNDTIFITFIVAHLKAGSSISDQESRALETEALMTFLQNKDTPANIIFSGDFNVRSSNETSFDNLINHANAQIRFYDPLNQLGTWNSNTDFVNIHTQSTRVTGLTNNGCFAAGGSDDRFDFILISEAVKDNLLKVNYEADSYTTPGQDGNRFNSSLNDPQNLSAPSDVISALYEMSDHYPVYLDLNVDAVLSSVIEQKALNEIIFKNPVADFLELKVKCAGCDSPFFEIINFSGNLVMQGVLEGENGSYYQNSNLNGLAKGIYLIKVSSKDGFIVSQKLVKL